MRQVQEKCLEQNLDLYSVSIGLTKAFDTVNREALWDVLARYGCPPKFIQIIRLFHVDMTGQVLSNGEQSDPFFISNGVKQGLVLAPVLLNLFFTCVLRQAVGNMDERVYVRFRYDGSIFDLRWLSAKTKTLNSLIQEALFADDCALMAHKPGDLQAMLNSFSDAFKQFGLTISLGETEVLFQRAPNSVAPQPAIFIDDAGLKVVDSFKYLGSMIASDGSLNKEIASRISKASQALGRLHNRLLNLRNITFDTKLKVCRAVVLSPLLYGCETWTVYRRHLKQLERFHQRALRSILGVRWQDTVTNTEVFERTNCISIEVMLLKSCLRWTGHVIRVEDHRITKLLLFGELEKGHREKGRPCKRFKDTVKAGLKWCGIPPTELVATALDRQRWRTLTQSASSALEEERRHQAQSARERRHLAASIPATTANFQCAVCARLCKSRIGLQSHSRVHRGTDNVILETDGPP